MKITPKLLSFVIAVIIGVVIAVIVFVGFHGWKVYKCFRDYGFTNPTYNVQKGCTYKCFIPPRA